MNTPALSTDNSPVTSFSSTADLTSPRTYFLSTPQPSSPSPVVSQALIELAALDVIDILSVHCMHMGGAYNAQLVSESASVAAMAVNCDVHMQTIYYYEIQDKVTSLLQRQTAHPNDLYPPPSPVPHNKHCLPSRPAAVKHQRTNNANEQRAVCPDCSRSFSRSDSLIRHKRKSCTYPTNAEKTKKSSRHAKHIFSARPY